MLYVSQRSLASEAVTASLTGGHGESSAVNHESSAKTQEPPRPLLLLINHTSLPEPGSYTHVNKGKVLFQMNTEKKTENIFSFFCP